MERHLRQLGWQEIEVVDDDLGRSAAGTVVLQIAEVQERKITKAIASALGPLLILSLGAIKRSGLFRGVF